jgi:hypothetical protein
MKSLSVITLALTLGFSGVALAQVSGPSGDIAPGSANGQRNGDAPGTDNIPGAPRNTTVNRGIGSPSSDVTGTMSDKNAGPSGARGNSLGPDGTPGNGSPAKQDGGQR